MGGQSCLRCGKVLPAGSLTYVVQVRVFAGFDGILLESEAEIEGQLKSALEQIEKSDPKEVEKEVYEEFTILLCKNCRDRFVDETRHPWEGTYWIQKTPDGTLH